MNLSFPGASLRSSWSFSIRIRSMVVEDIELRVSPKRRADDRGWTSSKPRITTGILTERGWVSADGRVIPTPKHTGCSPRCYCRFSKNIQCCNIAFSGMKSPRGNYFDEAIRRGKAVATVTPRDERRRGFEPFSVQRTRGVVNPDRSDARESCFCRTSGTISRQGPRNLAWAD